jgi:hypothetical protein
MVSKNSPNGLSRAAALSSNSGARLFSTKSICRDFPEDLLFKFTGNFDLSSSARTIGSDYIAIKNKRARGRIPTTTASLISVMRSI